MAYLAVNENGEELMFRELPKRSQDGLFWEIKENADKMFIPCIYYPKGTIKHLIGRELTWEDDPVEIK